MSPQPHEDVRPPAQAVPAGAMVAWWQTRSGCVGLSTLVAAVFVFWGLWRAPLQPWDEAWYARLALEMARGGDWWVYSQPGDVDESVLKPPLCLWVTAALFRLLGPTELATRLFSAFCYVALVAVVAAFCQRWLNARVALLASFLLATDRSLLTHHCARSGDMDAPLMLFLTLAVLAGWYVARQRRGGWSALALAGALLCKGAAALQILPPLYLWLIAGKAWRAALRWTVLLAISAAPFVVWLAMRESKQPGFASRMAGVDVYAHWTTQIDGPAGGTGLTHLLNLARTGGPVIIGLLVLAIGLRARFDAGSSVHTSQDGRRLGLLLLLWWLLPFGMFIAAGTYRSWYAYPAYVPAYMLAAWLLVAGLARLQEQGRRRLAALVLCVVLGGMGAPALWKVVHYSRSDRARAAELDQLIKTLQRAPPTPVLAYWPDPRVRFYLARARIPYEAVFYPDVVRERLSRQAGPCLLLLEDPVRDGVVKALPAGCVRTVLRLPHIGFVLAEHTKYWADPGP